MSVRNIMTVKPVSCAPETKLEEVARLMVEHDCGQIPVCDAGKLVGVVTDRDMYGSSHGRQRPRSGRCRGQAGHDGEGLHRSGL